jgi:hypothetical protein
MNLLAICTSSFEKFLFNSFAHFFHWDVDSLVIEFFEFAVDSGYQSLIG